MTAELIAILVFTNAIWAAVWLTERKCHQITREVMASWAAQARFFEQEADLATRSYWGEKTAPRSADKEERNED